MSSPGDTGSPASTRPVPPLHVEEPRGAARRASAVRVHLGVLLAFVLLSVAHTWPLAAQLKGFVAGGTEDAYVNMWQLAWLRESLWEAPAWPWFAPRVHWPLGAELYWHTLAPAKAAWGVVLLALTTPEAAYNLVLLGTFVLAGYTGWLFLRSLLLRAGYGGGLAAVAAFAGACAFTFCRFHWAHARSHLNLSAIEGLPLYAWCLLHFLDGGRRRWLVGTALAALYILLCDAYFFLYAALLSAIWVVGLRWREGPLLSLDALRSTGLRRAGAAALAVALACAPVLVLLLLHLRPPPLQLQHGDSDYYVDLLGLVLPDPGSWWHAVLPERVHAFGVQFARDTMAGNLEESGSYLGVGVLALAAWAVWRGLPSAGSWVAVGLLGATLSLGTMLSMAGERRHSPAVLLVAGTLVYAVSGRWRGRRWGRDVLGLLGLVSLVSLVVPLTWFGHPARFEVPLPYVVFKSVVPLFSQGGMPGRFLLLTMLALSVGVAFAAAHAGSWAGRRWPRGPAAVGAALAVALVVNVDLLGRDFPMAPLPQLPPVFDDIRRSPYPSAVYTDHVLGQWEQLYHRQPVSFARLARLPVRQAELERMRLTRVLNGDPWALQGPVSPAEAEAMRGYLREHHFRWFVSHRPSLGQHRFVTEVLQAELVHQDAYATVYRFSH